LQHLEKKRIGKINGQAVIDRAKKTFRLEAQAISRLESVLSDDFISVVRLILENKGKVVVTGIGKSAIVAQKIVATFNSTGTPALFLHAAEAIHGDIGMVQPEDLVLVLSKSGNTPEIKVLLPIFKQMQLCIVAMVSQTDSALAKAANYVLPLLVTEEACPHNLAPSTSTIAQMAMGDALAFCVLEQRGFTPADFAKRHPGGILGKQLYLQVSDLYPQNTKPTVFPNSSFQEVILAISSSLLGMTAVVDANNNLLGIITDGDLRRKLSEGIALEQLTANELMTTNPKTIPASMLALDALRKMQSNSITQLVVVEDTLYLGVVHLHDILKEGLF